MVVLGDKPSWRRHLALDHESCAVSACDAVCPGILWWWVGICTR